MGDMRSFVASCLTVVIVLLADARPGFALEVVFQQTLHGDLATAGVGVRGSGVGTLTVAYPPDSSVVRAYLYWNVLDPTSDKAEFNGTEVTGVSRGVGPSPCWPTFSGNTTYRADVTGLVMPGANSFKAEDSLDWDRAPSVEGASLYVVFQDPGAPLRTVQIADGNHTIHPLYPWEPPGADTASTTFGAFLLGSPETGAKVFLSVADGQSFTPETVAWNGAVVGSDLFDGSDGAFWDQEALSVATPGAPLASFTGTITLHTGDPATGGDCLVWLVAGLSAPSIRIELTNVIFDSIIDPSWTSDGLNIAYNFTKDLAHKAESGLGEWIPSISRNEPSLYVAGSGGVTVRIRLEVEGDGITHLDLEAVDLSGSWRSVRKRTISIAGGLSSPEFAGMLLEGLIPTTAQKARYSWDWRVSNINGSGSAPVSIATTGPHTSYVVLSIPTSPWYDNANSEPWVVALDFAFDDASVRANTQDEVVDQLVDFLYGKFSYDFFSFGACIVAAPQPSPKKDEEGKYEVGESTVIYYLEDLIRISRRPPPKGPRWAIACFDFAATVDGFASLLGCDAQLLHFVNFGYLKPTTFAGLLPTLTCNNPFFATQRIKGDLIVDEDALYVDADGDGLKDRTFFDTHAVVLYKGKVVDAASGPHRATESIEEYFNTVVDQSTKDEAKVAGDPKKDAVPRKVVLVKGRLP